MAKGLTSAYAPLGAVAMTEEIAAHFNDKVYYGGLTYNSHPISLAAAIATINVMQEDRIVEHAQQMGTVLRRHLNDLGEGHPSVGEVRSIGLFSAIEVVRNRKTREPMAPYNDTSPEMTDLRQYLLDNGLYTFIHWNVILVNPPLIINEEQLAEGFDVIDKALEITDRAVTE
jgi:taurine--2-oxoglutarate transaminase